jgi:acyl carrier protein
VLPCCSFSSFRQLGLDSLDEVEVVLMLEEEFVIDIQDEVASNILTLQDAVNYITNHPFAATDELHH